MPLEIPRILTDWIFKSRVILTPEHAKRFQKALADNIQRYENTHGEIPSNEPPQIPLNFGPTGEA